MLKNNRRIQKLAEMSGEVTRLLKKARQHRNLGVKPIGHVSRRIRFRLICT